MAGRRSVYCGGGVSDASRILLQNQRLLPSEPLDSLFLSASSPSFLGSTSMVSFEDFNGRKRSERSFSHFYDQEANGDDEMDEYLYQPEKKRRLSPDQVHFLEKSFEVDNKLEPERKVQLAKDLGLQPRQVAIWFQNRRARWKTKQLEKDYDVLQSSYEGLKADYDVLLKEKENLKAQVLQLKDKLIVQEKENGSSQSSETNQPSEGAQRRRPTADSASEGEVSKVSNVDQKQEDYHGSDKSDVMDSGSPHYIDGVHSSFLEPGDSSFRFKHDRSDQFHVQEDDSDKSLFHPPSGYVFPKVEDGDYTYPPVNSSYFTFPVEDQNFGFWSY